MNGCVIFRPCIIFAILLLSHQYYVLSHVGAAKAALSSPPKALELQHVVCGIGEFKCTTSDECIKEEFVCNGIVECKDNSDEILCDADEDFAYWDHLYRKQPTGINDEFDVGMCFFEMPKNHTCTCRGFDVLCSFQCLQTIPEILPDTPIINMLDMTHTPIYRINKNFLDNVQNYTVEIIALKFCNISTIETGALRLATEIRLRTLFLSENKLKYVNGSIFAENNVLETLVLSHNRIRSFHKKAFLFLNSLIELDLRGNRIEKIDTVIFKHLKSVKRIYLNDNRIKHISASVLSHGLNVTELSLVGNNIETIVEDIMPFSNLSKLYLSNNKITEIPSKAFCKSANIQQIMLQNNSLENVNSHSFDCLKNLSVDLSDNKFDFLDKNILKNSSIRNIKFSYFKLCQSVPHARRCNPNYDTISNEKNLIADPKLRICFWLLSRIAMAGNIMVLIYSWYQKTYHSTYGQTLYVRSLAVSDFLMGLYLSLISWADINYRDKYLQYGYEWRNGLECAFLGFLNTFSTVASMLLMMQIGVERFISVTDYYIQFIARRKVHMRFISVWTIAFIIASLPLLPLAINGYNFFATNSVCLPIHLDYAFTSGWQYTFFIFIFLNFIALVFSCGTQTLVIKKLLRVQLRDRAQKRERLTSIRCVTSLVVNIIVWLISFGEMLRRAFGICIIPCVYAWQAVFLYPIKAAINPLIYIYFTLVCELMPKVDRREQEQVDDIRLERIHPRRRHMVHRPRYPPEGRSGPPSIISTRL